MRAAAFLVLVAALAGCGGLQLSDVKCPPEGTPLTYDNFGKLYFSANCQRCHGAAVGRREGAPTDYNFATLDDARRWKERIFVRAASDDVSMPPGPDKPPVEEQLKLREWLSCGAPGP